MITIRNHYNGPIGRGHGGTSAGHFAGELEPDGATVRFHQPVPLDSSLESLHTPGVVSIVDGDTLIATVTDLAGPLNVGSFPAIAGKAVEQAERSWLDLRSGEHMAPTCFACGHERASGGLNLRPGPVGLTGIHATSWCPSGVGRVPSWMVWAALDCPTGFPAVNHVAADEAAVTGELSVQLLKPIMAGEKYTILSRRVGGEGRRHSTAAAVIAPDGSRLAIAKAIWVTVPMSVVRPELALAV